MTNSKGACIWFTGLSGAGKSTITEALLPLLDECGRTVSVLDVVPLLKKSWCERTSEGKLLRKAFVASEIVKHGGIAICVTVSARQETRVAARELISPESFIEVLVDVPPEVAKARKAKRKRKPSRLKRAKHALRGYAAKLPFRQKRAYEESISPDLRIDTMRQTPEEGAQAIFQILLDKGFVVPKESKNGSPTVAEKEELKPLIGQSTAGKAKTESPTNLVSGNNQ